MRGQSKKILTYVSICFLMISMIVPWKVQAAAPSVDIAQKGKITLDYSRGKADFQLYQIATVDSSFNFTIADKFAAYDGASKLNELKTTEDYQELAGELIRFIDGNSIEEDASKTTSTKGSGSFENLSVGMYLLTSSDEKATPSILVIPTKIDKTPASDAEWQYELTVKPKADNDNPKTPTTSTTSTRTTKKTGSATTSSKRLPQTGQLWWPVYVLAIAGVLFCTIGAVKNKRYNRER